MSRLRGLLGGLVLLGWHGVAGASNYFLDQIPHVVSRAEARRLQRVGVRTTDELAYRGATTEAREDLARVTGMTRERVLWLSALADLMRLRGVGPDAARMLSAAGCHSVGELQRANPQALANEIKRVNDRARLTTNPPRADNLVAWIVQAQHLPQVFRPDAATP